MAGPSWRTGEQPLLQGEAPLVVVLDMSGAMLANDLPPSRLLQARAKLATLLQQRSGGQVGLVVFAADAYTVAPLTRDDIGKASGRERGCQYVSTWWVAGSAQKKKRKE